MFKRIANLIRGFFGMAVSSVEKKNPEALLEVEKENLREQITQFNKGLAAHAGMCEKLMSQVKKLEAEEKDLTTKIKAHLTAGNKDAAGQYALNLQSVRTQLQENREQLDSAEITYKELIKTRDQSVQQAKAKIEQLKMDLNDLKVKQATAELSEMASGMVTEIGGAGDTLNRLQEMVDEERQKAAGRARVAKDSVDFADVKVKETEQKALADQALADFAAAEGIAMEGEAPASSDEAASGESGSRSMGPQSQ